MKCPRCQFENPSDTNFCSKCGWQLSPGSPRPYFQTETLLAPLYELERGTTFAGRYEIIEELGKGGMGRLYKVFDKKIRETVALKLLRPEIAADERTIERFSNELRFARRISHRNVCRMYDIGQEGTSYYITMEFVPGEDLKSFIRRSGHLTEAKAISIAKQVCEGLAEAHYLGVLHRDLKPQNVMIDREGNSRIMDFGIARSLYAQGITGPGVLIGTPEYMSPEQVEAEDVDQRSDIYSLGVILYEMVTGRVPFAGETPLSVALKHKTSIPKDPRELNSLVSEDLSRAILKCLEKFKERRFKSAEELRAELEKMEENIPTVERVVVERKPITSREITVKFSLMKVLKPAIVLMGMIFIALMIWRLLPREEKTPPAASKMTKVSPPSPSLPSEGQISQEIGKLIAGLAKKEGQESGGTKGARGFFESMLKEAAKYMNQQDYEKLKKTMEVIKGKIPADSHLMSLWNEVDAKIKEGEKRSEAGKIQESQKNYEEGQNQMRDLMALVEEKENADAARTEMEQEKKRATETLPAGKENLLYRIASAREQDAAGAYHKDDFSGAKTLYVVLKRVFGLSVRAVNEESGLVALQGFVQELKSQSDSIKAPALASWLYEQAKKEELHADELYRKKEYGGAADTYVQAAFLYERANEKALEIQKAK